jgi:hypothetical protein
MGEPSIWMICSGVGHLCSPIQGLAGSGYGPQADHQSTLYFFDFFNLIPGVDYAQL